MDDRGNVIERLRAVIEDTLLVPDRGPAAVTEFCRRAVNYRFFGVCVNPVYVRLAAAELAGSGLTVVTVAGFPLGANRSDIKAREVAQAVSDGAAEVDMVMNIGLMKEREYKAVEDDIKEVVRSSGVPVKVILECCYLNDDEISKACELALSAGARFVKTSTGFGPGGARVEDVSLMRSVVGGRVGVKASGGIRTTEQALAMLEAGADRIGTSRGPEIVGGSPPQVGP